MGKLGPSYKGGPEATWKSGADMIWSDRGNDAILGRVSDNPAYVEDQYDFDTNIIFGGAGNDTITGGQGADEIRGGKDVDFIQGHLRFDRLSGDQGNDTIYGFSKSQLDGDLCSENSIYWGDWDALLIGSADIDNIEGARVHLPECE